VWWRRPTGDSNYHYQERGGIDPNRPPRMARGPYNRAEGRNRHEAELRNVAFLRFTMTFEVATHGPRCISYFRGGWSGGDGGPESDLLQFAVLFVLRASAITAIAYCSFYALLPLLPLRFVAVVVRGWVAGLRFRRCPGWVAGGCRGPFVVL